MSCKEEKNQRIQSKERNLVDENKLQPEPLKKLGGKLKKEKMKGSYTTAKKTRGYKPKDFQADRGKLRSRSQKKTKETGGCVKIQNRTEA